MAEVRLSVAERAVVVGATPSSSELRRRRRSYAVVTEGEHPGLVEEGEN